MRLIGIERESFEVIKKESPTAFKVVCKLTGGTTVKDLETTVQYLYFDFTTVELHITAIGRIKIAFEIYDTKKLLIPADQDELHLFANMISIAYHGACIEYAHMCSGLGLINDFHILSIEEIYAELKANRFERLN